MWHPSLVNFSDQVELKIEHIKINIKGNELSLAEVGQFHILLLVPVSMSPRHVGEDVS